MANEPKSKKTITGELLDELLNGEDPKEAFLNGGLIDDLKQAIADRALNAEMDLHLEQDEEQSSGNHRNGTSRKRVLSDSGAMDVSIPRDPQGRFDPRLIEKYRRRLPGFDEKVIALYSHGRGRWFEPSRRSHFAWVLPGDMVDLERQASLIRIKYRPSDTDHAWSFQP